MLLLVYNSSIFLSCCFLLLIKHVVLYKMLCTYIFNYSSRYTKKLFSVNVCDFSVIMPYINN